MINIYIVMFNIEGKRKLKRFFIHASDIEDAEKFAYKKLKELENEYGKKILLRGVKKNNDIKREF